MSPVDSYISTLTPPQQAELNRIRGILHHVIPTTEDGVSYGMPVIKYKGWQVISIMVRKNFISLYPYSGTVFNKLKDKVAGFETTPGSIHFTLDNPLPESLLKEIIQLRVEEIEERGIKSKLK